MLASMLLLSFFAASPAPRAAIADLAWLAGHWESAVEGGVSEEVWTAPAGDSMMGMWRYVAGGRPRVFEILTITAEEGGPVLRLRHFDPRLVAREERDAPIALPLVSAGAREATFAGRGTEGTVRITYRRDGDVLVSTLEKEGRPPQPFRFRRRAP